MKPVRTIASATPIVMTDSEVLGMRVGCFILTVVIILAVIAGILLVI